MKKPYIFSLLGLLLPIVSLAATADYRTVGGVFEVACTLFNYLFIILIMAAVVFILLSAFDYLTANGDSKKVNEAGKKLMYAIIAVIVALVAKYVPFLAASVAGLDFSDARGDAYVPSCLR